MSSSDPASLPSPLPPLPSFPVPSDPSWCLRTNPCSHQTVSAFANHQPLLLNDTHLMWARMLSCILLLYAACMYLPSTAFGCRSEQAANAGSSHQRDSATARHCPLGLCQVTPDKSNANLYTVLYIYIYCHMHVRSSVYCQIYAYTCVMARCVHMLLFQNHSTCIHTQF